METSIEDRAGKPRWKTQIIRIDSGGAKRIVSCLACHATGEISNEEPIEAAAEDIGKEIVEALDEAEFGTHWGEGYCEDHAHLIEPPDHFTNDED